jgi:hypothetical protein
VEQQDLSLFGNPLQSKPRFDAPPDEAVDCPVCIAQQTFDILNLAVSIVDTDFT